MPDNTNYISPASADFYRSLSTLGTPAAQALSPDMWRSFSEGPAASEPYTPATRLADLASFFGNALPSRGGLNNRPFPSTDPVALFNSRQNDRDILAAASKGTAGGMEALLELIGPRITASSRKLSRINPGRDSEDIAQAERVAVAEAVTKPGKDMKDIMYGPDKDAGPLINSILRRAGLNETVLANSTGAVGIPREVQKHSNLIRKFEDYWQTRYGTMPRDEFMTRRLGLTQEQIDRARIARTVPQDINKTRNVFAGELPGDDAVATSTILSKELGLTEPQSEAMKLLLGLGEGSSPMTLREIATQLGVSHVAIHKRIEGARAKILKKYPELREKLQ